MSEEKGGERMLGKIEIYIFEQISLRKFSFHMARIISNEVLLVCCSNNSLIRERRMICSHTTMELSILQFSVVQIGNMCFESLKIFIFFIIVVTIL
jgi:hypothetical protein